MDLSKPDMVCVYCGTNAGEVKALRVRIAELEKIREAAEELSMAYKGWSGMRGELDPVLTITLNRADAKLRAALAAGRK